MPRRDFGSGSAFDRDDWGRYQANRSAGNRPSWQRPDEYDRGYGGRYDRGANDYDPRDYHARVSHPSDYDRMRDEYERQREMSRRHYGDRPARYARDAGDYRATHYDRERHDSGYFQNYDTSERYRDREPRSFGAPHNNVYDRWGSDDRGRDARAEEPIDRYQSRGRTDPYERDHRGPDYFARDAYRRDFRRYRADRNENQPDNDFDRFRGRGLW